MPFGYKVAPDPVDDIIDGVHYPSSDGKPMAETGIHVLTIMLLYQAATRLPPWSRWLLRGGEHVLVLGKGQSQGPLFT